MDDFAVFILTHGRSDNVKTYQTLRRGGYTGNIYLIIDNEDTTAQQYYDLYGEQVIMFDKKAVADSIDEGGKFSNDRRSVVYARNACFEIARNLGLDYFLQLDDDYTVFRYMYKSDYSVFRNTDAYPVKSLDTVFFYMVEFLKETNAKTICFGQSGDYIGGVDALKNKNVRLGRKAMNSFFCKTDSPIKFLGKLNDDVNTYVRFGGIGELFFTVFQVSLRQMATQRNPGGLTNIYVENGTYIKSFMTTLYAPSCVRIDVMGATDYRIHHRIKWNNAVPKIIREFHRKPLAHV